LQNSPLDSGYVVVALIQNYSTSKLSKPLKVSHEKSQMLSYDTAVANGRYIRQEMYVERTYKLGAFA